MVKKFVIILESLLLIATVTFALLGIWSAPREQWLATAALFGMVTVTLLVVLGEYFE